MARWQSPCRPPPPYALPAPATRQPMLRLPAVRANRAAAIQAEPITGLSIQPGPSTAWCTRHSGQGERVTYPRDNPWTSLVTPIHTRTRDRLSVSSFSLCKSSSLRSLVHTDILCCVLTAGAIFGRRRQHKTKLSRKRCVFIVCQQTGNTRMQGSRKTSRCAL